MKNKAPDLINKAAFLRGRLLDMSHGAKASHLGSALSCIDIITALYFDVLNLSDPEHRVENCDRFILSKGHAVAALYAVLAEKKIITEQMLETFTQPGSPLEEHPGPGTVPGIEVATGSLGHGLSIGTGMALSQRLNHSGARIFVLMSDGECNEGSVWEAAMFAAGQSLDNLCVIVDFNKWQATGRSCDIMALEPLSAKFESFGWDAVTINGHDMAAIIQTFDTLPLGKGRPVAVIADTIKGRGISFIEDDNNWHYRIPTAGEVVQGKKELGLL